MQTNRVIALTTVSAAVLFAIAGCGDKPAAESSSSSSSSSKASSSSAASATTSAAAKDYSSLLIAAADIVAPGDTFTAQAPTLDPNGTPGVVTVFSNAGDTREIGDTILVLPDAGAAETAFQAAQASLGGSVTGGAPQVANVGDDSSMVAGTSPDGSKAVTVLLFVQGAAFTTLEFDSAPGDPVPPEFVLDVAGKQAAAIKSGLG